MCSAANTQQEDFAETHRNPPNLTERLGGVLIRNGFEAHILPADLVKRPARYRPYIYSKDDVAKIWAEFDNLKQINRYPTRQIVLSALVRVFYCCGLRPIEARRLKVSDVDLQIGRFFIRESKGCKDRIVMLADDITEYLRAYDRKITNISGEREWFFPGPNGGFCPYSWINDNYLQICRKLRICTIDGKSPRMYDLRHTMATHRLYEWMKSGVDLNEKIQYLSRYLGHAQLSDTYYYIHLVPEQLQSIAGLDLSKYENLLPEVMYNE
jgi:integrase